MLKNFYKFNFLGTKPRSLGLSKGKRVLRFRGSGVSHQKRILDHFFKIWNIWGTIIRIEYGGSRLYNLISFVNGLFCYQLSFQGSFIGRQCMSSLSSTTLGSANFLKNFPRGSRVFNIESYPFSGSKFCRSAGTSAKVVRILESEVLLRLPSSLELWVSSNCVAMLGIVNLSFVRFNRYLGAGTFRRLGWRPRVRGVAMNPVDHPHGGGEGKSSGGRLSVSRWGWLTKSMRTTRSIRRR